MRASLEGLHRRPGFMIRRAHQIAVSVFIEETAELGITTTQYGILYALARRPDINQISVARLLGLDRSTTGMVLKTLEDGGLVCRVVDKADRRKRSLELSAAGHDLLGKLKTPASRAVERLLAPLDPEERAVFLRLLDKLTHAFNATSRVPLLDERVAGEVD
ncbi:transcriptional regulator, MarR family [Rhizobiales bacterium GAS113]|nr:transcriptional regulator, MarR family [Rhizobiales bacterium GAS113]